MRFCGFFLEGWGKEAENSLRERGSGNLSAWEKNSSLSTHLKGGKTRKREGGEGGETPLKAFPSGGETPIFRAG